MPREQEAGPITPLETSPAVPRWWQQARQVLPQDLSQRARGVVLALGIELLIVLLLLSLSFTRPEPEVPLETVSSFDVGNPPAPAAEEAAETPAPSSATAPIPQAEQPPTRPSPLQPDFARPPTALPRPQTLPVTPPPPAPRPTPSASPTIGVRIREGSSYGPADTGNSRGEDSAVVGTAPDGSPLYAARWFREPRNDELAGYLSTASSTGWGLIACRTAPNWRVEDCEIIDEYPQGSGIARATRAAAWQFQVRPPRLGGEYQVGSWVRIRIDYTRTIRTL